MIWKTTLALLVTLFSLGSSFAQFSDTQPDLRDTFTGNCTADSYTVLDVYLSDINGTPISDQLKSCTIGETKTVYISVRYISNAQSDNHNARIFADIIVDGELYGEVNYFEGVLPAAKTEQIITLENVTYNWTCGEELQLTNFLVVWTTNATKNLSTSYSNKDYNQAQCQFPPNIRVSAPLAVEFDYEVCTTNGVATVNYTSTTSGGFVPLTYNWDFDSNGTIDATTPNASYNFSGSSTTTTLTVIDQENTTSSYTLTINKPTEVVASIFGDTELSCNTSSLVLDATGSTLAGTPSYSWSTGETSSSITVAEAGEYTVTVTDATGCSDTESITIVDVPDSEEPSITCPADLLEVPADNGECFATGVALGSPVISDNCNSSEELTVTNNAPSSFPIGETTVVWTVTDALGNVSTCNQLVVVVDEQAPVITANDNITTTTDNGLCSAAVTILPATATDNCTVGTVTGTRDDGEALDALYPVGTTIITWNVADENGNDATPVSQTVTVTDEEAPEITSEGSVTVSADNDLCTAVVDIIPATATDNCTVGNPAGTRNDGLALDAPYPLGVTTITWSVSDQNGNEAISVTQTVTVTDDQAPIADNETLPLLKGECAVEIIDFPTATDNCEGQITGTTNDPLLYETQGTYWITWTFTDSEGNTSKKEQQVAVDDTTAPEAITIADATGECEVTVTAPSTTDNCAGTIVGTTQDPLTYTEQGEYVITWSFDDGNGNVTTATQNVIVNDVSAPEAITIADATGECEVTVTAPSTTDNCAGTIVGTTEDPLTYTEQGEYVITWSFNDGNGNITTATQNVIVNDVTAPVAVELETITGNCEVTVVAPTTTDNCAGTITGTTQDLLTYSDLGTYEITWTFDDNNGNTTTATQQVIVQNTTAPVAPVLADAVAECEITVAVPTTTNACTGETIEGTTTDPLTYTEQGEYQITWTFDDGDGNVVTSVQNVIINDTTAPEAISIADATGECEVTVTAPSTTDNCAGTIVGTTEDPLTYTEQGEYTITWSFNDGHGNITTATQKVIVDDATAPEVITIADATGECEVTVTTPSTSDNCAGTIVGTTEDPLTYTEQGEYVITWSFNDGNGNVTTATQNVIVDDITAPEAISIANATGECEVTVTAPSTTDNCAGTIVGTTEDPLTYTEQGEYVITWSFNDGNGNTTTATQNVIVNDVTAPVAVELEAVTGNCEVTVVAPTTTDACAETITATTNDPLTYSELGTYEVTWTFDDNNGNTTTATQQVVVQNTTAPVAPVLADAVAECEITVAVPTTTNTCTGETIEGTTTDPLTYSEQGEYQITWTFDDGDGNVVTSVQNVIINDNTAPEAIAIADATGECEVTVTAPSTTDNCVGEIVGTTEDPLTYTEQGEYVINWSFEDGNGNITTATQNVIVDDVTAPEAITITDATGECEVTVTAPSTTDNCVGTIVGTTEDPLTYTKQGEYVITWSFNDGNGNITTATQNVIVDDITAPEAISIADATGECEVTVTAPSTTDNCAGSIIATTVDPLTYTEQGEYVITWSFDDGNGNITTAIQNVVVDDITAPVAVELETVTGNCEVTVVAPTTTDACAETITASTNDPLTYYELGTYEITWTFDDNNGNTTTATQQVVVQNTTAPVAPVLADAVAECEITVAVPTTTNACTGETIEGTTTDPLTYTEQGEYQITWTFDDGNGNSTTATQNVIVDDTTAPEAITIADATGECEVTVTAPSTTDNCAGTIVGTTQDPLTYTEQGEYIINWSFDDGNGNSTTATQNVVVDDITAPEAIAVADATGECEVTVTAPSTSDNCAGTIVGTTEDPLTYTEQGEYIINWSFDDGNGNSTTATQNVVVDDITAPEAIAIADATGECEVTVTAPSTSDNCAGTIVGTTQDPLTYTEQGEYVITWSFDDGNGNITTATQNVIVDDVTAPEVIAIADATGECEVTVTAPSTSDNCTGTIVGTTEDPLTYSEQGEYVITWTFDDNNGNTTTATQNVIVDDITAPVAVDLETVTGNCEVTVVAPTTTDNCAGTITGTTEDPLTYSELGTYEITWTFDDNNGNTTTATQQVIVQNTTAPVAPVLADAVAECEITVAVPSTTNACTGETIKGTTADPLAYSEQGEYQVTWTFDDGDGNMVTSVQNVIINDITAPEAITIADATGECEVTVAAPSTTDNCAGTIVGTTEDPLTYNEQGEYVINWTFDDGNGNITTATQNVIVDDVTAPAAITIADAIGECEVTVTAPSTTDNCAGTLVGTTEDPLTYTEQGEYVITWSFNDGNGNITTAIQNVIVDDVTAPVAVELETVTGNCEVTVVAPTTTDNCAGTITATTNDPFTYSELGTYEITWTFDDNNGNTTTATQQVIVQNTTAPVAPVLADAVAECEITVAVPTTTNACTGETIEGTTTDPLTYSEQGEYQVTWTFDDGDGNVVTSVQNVIINDTTAPEAITIADATGECEVTVSAPSTSDICVGEIVGTTEDPLTYTEQGEYVITWSFNDGNGNTTTATQNVIVDDVTAPEALTIADATGECEVTVTVPSTSDNCAGEIAGTTEDSLTYTEQGEYQITWSFNDENGNITTATQNVIVDDVTAPEAITLADATGECEVTVTAPSTTDNCAGTIVGTTEDPLTYAEQGEYVINWSFDDGNGNITTATQNVIVDDITAPEAISIADATGECEVTVSAPSTSDNCAGTIVGTTEDPLTYTEQGEYVITWSFNDGNGNITTATQNVIVDDVTAPEAITLADATGECEVTVAAPSTTDNCAGTIVGTTEDPLTYTEQGEFMITWSFNDGNGNITTGTQNIIVEDVTAPEAINIADATGECEVTVTAPSTTDNCAGIITGTTTDPLTYTEQGEHVITWSFNDGNGNITTATQNIIVDDVTAPETITIADATGECEVTVTAPSTTDNCAGTIVGTTEDLLTYSEQGEYVINWSFDDGNGNITTATQNVIVDDITAPEAISIADATGECEVTVSAPSTSDNCAGTIVGTTENPLSYTEQGEYVITWSFNDGNGNTTTATQNVIVDDVTAPEAISIADATGECEVTVTAPSTSDNCAETIVGTTEDPLTYTEQGEFIITWSFNDGNGNTTTATQNVIVDDVTAPEAITLADATGECEVTVTAPSTTDNCAGTIVGTTEDPLTYSEQGEYVITWSFNDGNGNITTATQNVIVNDITAPEAITMADATGECEVTVTAPSTSDNCAGEITGTTEDPLTYTEQGEYIITWSFNDGNGNITTATQNVIVEDTSAPEWTTALPSDVTVSCNEVPEAASLTAEDGCDVNVSFSEEIIAGECESNYSIIRTWTATDGAGNAATHIQTITVADVTAPVVAGSFEEMINITCEEIPVAPELSFTDNCSTEVNVEFEEIMTNGENGDFTITRTWTVTDCPGNEAVYVQTVNVSPEDDEIETSTVDLCTEDSTFDLFELLTGEFNENGTWEDTMESGALTGSFIDPALLEVGQYTFDYVIENGECSSTTTVQVSINDDCIVLPCGIDDIRSSISKAVIPNGNNRYFTVGLDVDCGFTYNVKIFNRWGSKVFEADNYQNNWDGTSSSSLGGSNQLPAGTYYYIVEINQGGFEPIQSYIYLGTK